jgi:hypothetical protein
MKIKILVAENTPIEISLIDQALKKTNLSYKNITFLDELENVKHKSKPKIILSRNSLLNNNKKKTLEIRKEFYYYIPFVFIADQIAIGNFIAMVKKSISHIALLQAISNLHHEKYKALKENIKFNKNLLSKQTEKKDSHRLELSVKENTLQATFESIEAFLLSHMDNYKLQTDSI